MDFHIGLDISINGHFMGVLIDKFDPETCKITNGVTMVARNSFKSLIKSLSSQSVGLYSAVLTSTQL